MKSLTVIIPSRNERPITKTLNSLQRQTFQDFVTVVQPDFGNGGNWARNKGFEACRTEYVLFCDDDIDWMPDGIEAMVDTLDATPDAAYSYGSYQADVRGRLHLISDRQFDPVALRKNNFVSTMSVIRSDLFPGFDENLKRLQDWDLWLTMLEQGHVGKHCGKIIFRTVTDPKGVTFGTIPWPEAYAAIRKKHPV